MASPAQIKANIKYNKSRDSITIRPTKEDGAQIRDDAAAAGQSIQTYILQACQERRERDASK
jgi:predicted DNA binding CopG/RHH family protein